jgi:hypothetical protein
MCRKTAASLAVGLTLIASVLVWTAPAPAEAASCPPVVSIGCGLVGGAVGAVGDVAGDVLGAGAKVVGSTLLNGVSDWVGAGAAWLIERIGKRVEQSTRPELGATWFTDQYQSMLSLALILTLGFLMAALASAALRQDLAEALRAAFVALPLAVIACFAAVTIVEVLLVATDNATMMLTQSTSGNSEKFFKDLGGVFGPGGAAVPGFLALIGALIAALLCVVVWLELILREAAVYLAVAFLPLSLAAMVWRRSAHLARRLCESLMAVILAKLTIATAVAFAASALAHKGSGGITAMLAGCAVLFLAALSPWMLLRLIPLSGETHLHRGSVKQAAASAPGMGGAAFVVRTGMYSSFGGAAGGALATSHAPAASAPPPPSTPPSAPSGLGMRLEPAALDKPAPERSTK